MRLSERLRHLDRRVFGGPASSKAAAVTKAQPVEQPPENPMGESTPGQAVRWGSTTACLAIVATAALTAAPWYTIRVRLVPSTPATSASANLYVDGLDWRWVLVLAVSGATLLCIASRWFVGGRRRPVDLVGLGLAFATLVSVCVVATQNVFAGYGGDYFSASLAWGGYTAIGTVIVAFAGQVVIVLTSPSSAR
jgi:hypothetical protein